MLRLKKNTSSATVLEAEFIKPEKLQAFLIVISRLLSHYNDKQKLGDFRAIQIRPAKVTFEFGRQKNYRQLMNLHYISLTLDECLKVFPFYIKNTPRVTNMSHK